MTIYTAKLGQLTATYAAHLEKQMADALNPKASVVGSLLRTAFRTKVTGVRLITEIYREAGWNTADDQVQRLAELAELATKNGDPAGARLKKSVDAFATIEKSLPADAGIFSAMKQAKKQNFSL